VRPITETLGELPVADLDDRVVTEWQAALGRKLAPRTVRLHRQTLAQVVDEAVKLGALIGNPKRSVKPLRVTEPGGVALALEETKALIAAARDHRVRAAVALLFLQAAPALVHPETVAGVRTATSASPVCHDLLSRRVAGTYGAGGSLNAGWRFGPWSGHLRRRERELRPSLPPRRSSYR